MQITLTVVEGPHKGQQFWFSRHDTFLVGRSQHAHFQLPLKDKYFSRIHFMIEVNPPQCRLVDMGSHNGTYVNGVKVTAMDLNDGALIRAGHTILKLSLFPEEEAPLPAAPASVPREIPGYNLGPELGRGGMGVVYLATRQADASPVALKIISPTVAASSAQIDQFLREAHVLTELDHPHIVRFQDLGAVGGLLFVVMDYVRGTDAAAILQKTGPLAIPRAVQFIDQVLQALEFAHAKKFIHRDIKPANLLVAGLPGQESVLLADFGLARVYQSSPLSGLSMTIDLGGSVAFMPPERITNYQAADPPADQYAAAATLYTLLTGQHIFDFPSEVHRRISVILRQQPIPIQARRADISTDLGTVIHKALSRNPAQRFANVADFRQALLVAVNH